MKLGAHGPEVLDLQRRLAALGFVVGPQDSDYGRMTRDAVRQFQASAGLASDGIAGEATWNALATGRGVGPVPTALVESAANAIHALPQGLVRTSLEVALAEVGTVEDPFGSNGGPRVDVYTDNWRVPWCFTGEAEILTADGWVPFGRLADGVAVAQVDPDTFLVSLTQPTSVIRRDYEGELVTIERRSLRLTLDPNHRLYGEWTRPARKGTAQAWPTLDFGTVGDLATGTASTVSIPSMRGVDTPDVAINDRDLRLMGAFIADGFNHRGRLECAVSRADKIEMLRALEPVHEYTAPRAYGPRSRQPMTSIQFTYPDGWEGAWSSYKVLAPAFMWSLSRRQAGLLLDTVRVFDGGMNGLPETGQQLISQASKERIDALHHLAVLAGYPAGTCEPRARGEFGSEMFGLRYSHAGRSTRITSDQATTRYGRERLYCVSVPSGLIVVRPPFGKAVIVGNCALFGSWCIREGRKRVRVPLDGEPKAFPPHRALASAWKIRKWATMGAVKSSRSRWYTAPKAGDVFVIINPGAGGVDVGRGHVGFVVRAEGEHLLTIEGNADNGVRVRRRDAAHVAGYARWA